MCEQCRSRQSRTSDTLLAPHARDLVTPTVSSSGASLDARTRARMEERFGYDFSRVRVHADAPAAASAQAVGATAYAVGQHVAFAQHAYAPDTESGDKLLAHELAHVVQQNTASLPPTGALKLPTGSSAEREADAMAARAIHAERLSPPAGRPLSALARGSSRRASGGRVGARAEARTGAIVERGPEAQVSLSTSFVAPGTVQRQLITPLGPGGGYRGVMSRDQAFNRRLMATPYRVCSRPLQVGGFIANHAYIEAPPYRYAVIGPRCTPTDGGSDNIVFGGGATSKWDNSPDPCDQSPVNRVPCEPAPGVTDVGQCLRNAYNAYNSPNRYLALGPNSNTFAGTLARIVHQPVAAPWSGPLNCPPEQRFFELVEGRRIYSGGSP
jgi:Domain of unknown function (DUF4157)